MTKFFAAPFFFVGGLLLSFACFLLLVAGWIETGNTIDGSIFTWDAISEGACKRYEEACEAKEGEGS